MNSTFFKFYDIYTEENKRYFSEEFLKNNTFDDIVHPKFKDLGMRFTVLAANVQLITDIVNNIKIHRKSTIHIPVMTRKKLRISLNSFISLPPTLMYFFWILSACHCY